MINVGGYQKNEFAYVVDRQNIQEYLVRCEYHSVAAQAINKLTRTSPALIVQSYLNFVDC